MGLNLSAGFAGLSEGLGRMGNYHAQQDLEELRSARAENLARMTQDRQFKHDEAVAARQERNANIRADQENKHTEQMQRDYLERVAAMEAGRDSRASAAASAQDERDRRKLISQNRMAMANAMTEHDNRINDLMREIRLAAKDNFELEAIKDPQERTAAMARDSVIGPMMGQLVELRRARQKAQTAYILNGIELGDTGFKGFTGDQLPQPKPKAQSPYVTRPPAGETPAERDKRYSDYDQGSDPAESDATPAAEPPTGRREDPWNQGYSADTVANPFENASNYTGGPNPYAGFDPDAPAVRKGAAGSPTIPQLLGPQPPPLISRQGPLQLPSQIIPMNGQQQGPIIPGY